MNIAQQIKAFSDDINAILDEATRIGIVTQNWEKECTEIDFVDGSVMIICNSTISIYGARP
jgi:hypothetical protein